MLLMTYEITNSGRVVTQAWLVDFKSNGCHLSK